MLLKPDSKFNKELTVYDMEDLVAKDMQELSDPDE